MKDNCEATPIKCPVDVSSPGNPSYQSQQDGKKREEQNGKES